MNIKILTPEFVIFEGEVDSILVPGKSGQFQIFKNHAAIVSSLVGGKVKIYTDKVNAAFEKYLTKETETKNAYSYEIKNGVLEFSRNNGIILCE
ncbi:FoF1 ATP synthase subunit delta/epsilon [Chryseobacterium sp. SC28]|uniref:FoF1 ATP synthase subunit delta/epsilon n=1 Tax=Chryseobacterium sp. SC28 TaxID=2268028 RepID=UPI000F64EE57|nr:F0F1 ATP synthase subunit epsilon [Chryseobacterium sp. SC28]RRQ45752.1 F0F1 ATP synthase subunit epsilon [Chryseobacterium sp. SC28]